MGESTYYCKKYTANKLGENGKRLCFGHDVKEYQKKRTEADWNMFLKNRKLFYYTNEHKQSFLETGSIHGRKRRCVSTRIDGVLYTGVHKQHCSEISFNNKNALRKKNEDVNKGNEAIKKNRNNVQQMNFSQNGLKLMKSTNIKEIKQNNNNNNTNQNNVNNKYPLLLDTDIDSIMESLDTSKFEFLERVYWDKWSYRVQNRIEKRIRDAIKDRDCNRFAWYYNTQKHNTKKNMGKCLHWICAIFIYNQDDKTYTYTYFDSFGSEPPKHIEENLNIIGTIFQKVFSLKDVKFDYNKKVYQHNSTECGVWVIWFIHNMLLKRSLNNNLITKNEMRNRYVRKSCRKKINLEHFHEIKVRGDGHCAYRTILLYEHYLKTPNVSMNQLRLINSNTPISAKSIHNLRKQVKNMGIKGKENEKIVCKNNNACDLCEWASFETISLYCQQKGYQLCIYREIDGRKAVREQFVTNGSPKAQNSNNVLFILYNGSHYNLLIPRMLN
jgi:hypothetical protein